jgi:hypothetical protein
MTSPGTRELPFAAVLAAATLLGGCVGQIGSAAGGPATGSGAGGSSSSSGGAIGTGGSSDPAGTGGSSGPIGTGGSSSPAGTGGSSGPIGTGGSSGPAGTGGSSGPMTVASDLPCSVAALLGDKCATCHGPHPAGGAPMSLTNYAEMTAPAISDPSKTMAVVAVSRMMNTTAPMPPVGFPQATSAEIGALQSWISAGYPTTGCSMVTTTNGPDGGTPPPPDPFSVAPTCTSGKSWTGGTEGSGSMQPGVACINCHNSSGGEAPRFTIAGTLYPTAHEPNQCNGANGNTTGAKVVITDANQNVVTLTPNSVGNFYYTGTIATPFHAKVTDMNGERDMLAGQTSGDCNACHTQNGTMSAPGRIILP